MFIFFLLLLFEVSPLFAQNDVRVIDVVAPELRMDPSDTEDLNLCFSVKLPDDGPFYATSFYPTSGAISAHHIKLYACEPGMPEEEVWACGPEPLNVDQYYHDGPICQGAHNDILYVWAKNASNLTLPEDVAFKLESGSHLTVALHYKGASNFPRNVTPGVSVVVTKKRPSKFASVLMMHSSKNSITPYTTEFWDMECEVGDEVKPFYPFAFRVHTHYLGKGVMGYKVDGRSQKWTMIGEEDPNLPQNFYDTENPGSIVVRPGDMLAARCIMVNNLNKTIQTGAKDSDEMCVYYIMFYTEGEARRDQILNRCVSKHKKGRWEFWFKNIPSNANSFRGITYTETDPRQYQSFGSKTSDTDHIDVVAPELRVRSKDVEDLQLCFAVQVPDNGTSFATGFEPNYGAKLIAHHMRLFSCAPGLRNEAVWVCNDDKNPFPNDYAWGPPCMTEERTLYLWAKNASKLDLPEDVGFYLPPASHLVLAIHYKNPESAPVGATPGVRVTVTKEVPSKVAGVFQIINDYNLIGPNRTEFWDIACQVEDGILPFYPFAFRVHSHHIGRAILGYKIDGQTGEWTKIGAMDPMLPHAFYPVQTDGYVQVAPGDKLAARCIMVNDQDRVVTTGPKDSDEMCIFYVMYYIQTNHKPLSSQLMHECLSSGKVGNWNRRFPKVPQDANQYNGVTYIASEPDPWEEEILNEPLDGSPTMINITAPELKVDPSKVEDLQLCYAVQVPKGGTSYAIGFDPTDGAMRVAHHMRLFSCAPGIRTDEAWACASEGNPYPDDYQWGPPCMTEEKTIYVWAKNASSLQLPDDVGFHLRSGSHIVLALHYKNPGDTPREVTPGVRVKITQRKPSKAAGVFQLINDYNKIGPHRTEFWDVACQVEDGKLPFYPFAFRVHAHHIGRAIVGYKIDGQTNEWTKIGAMDPMLPHAFYPVQTDGYVKISPGDKLASRCIMVNDQNRTITTGPKDSDEMCILYIMYYVESDHEPQTEEVIDECINYGDSGRWSRWFPEVPDDGNQYKGVTYQESEPETEKIEVIAPELRIDPDMVEDFHLCYSLQIPEGDDWYAVAFEPTEGAVVAHHMKMFSCAPGIRTDSVWQCGPAPFETDAYQHGIDCISDDKMLYVWAKNASRLDLPEDVAFHLPGGSHIVLTLHYKGVSPDVPKNLTPGVNIYVTKRRPSKKAGVFMMVNSYNSITPHTTEFWDASCKVPDGVAPFFPFGFRTHSHHLGRGIIGYKIDGPSKQWTLIGEKDPMLPQAFYTSPMNGSVGVYPGDMLASRCFMVNDKDEPIYTGPSDSDEMCIFYIMYYMDSDTPDHLRMHDCSSDGKLGRWSNWFSNIPPNSDVFEGVKFTETIPKRIENANGDYYRPLNMKK